MCMVRVVIALNARVRPAYVEASGNDRGPWWWWSLQRPGWRLRRPSFAADRKTTLCSSLYLLPKENKICCILFMPARPSSR